MSDLAICKNRTEYVVKVEVKEVVWSPDSMTMHVQQTLPFPWKGECQYSLQLLIQPWICAPGTHYGWVDRGSVEYKVCPTLGIEPQTF